MATDMSQQGGNDTARQGGGMSRWKIILPVIIGLAVVGWLFWRDARSQNIGEVWASISFTPYVVGCILLAWLFMIGRDFGLSWRFRALTDRQLSWGQAIRVNCLCEFTSCITPSAVGGSSLGMVFLNREGIELGRATTLMLTTLFLDELFFVVSCPLVVLFTPAGELFNSGGAAFQTGLQFTFWIVYGCITAWTALLFCGIILWPRGISALIRRIFRWRRLRRWQQKGEELADNMVATAASLRSKPLKFWLETFGGTALSWTSRYLVVNALFMAFVPQADPQQWLILARQFVVWVVLMVSPTPGGSGLSEWLFTEFYGSLIPSAALALIMAIFWRIISYYVYLVIGAILVPRWLRDSFKRKSK